MNMRFVKRIITLLLSMSFTFSAAQTFGLRVKGHPENIKPGKYLKIKWESGYWSSNYVKLQYCILPSNFLFTITNKYPAYLRTYQWKIPKHLKGENIKLVIKNSKNPLLSDSTYILVSGKKIISTQDIVDHTKRLKEKYDIAKVKDGDNYSKNYKGYVHSSCIVSTYSSNNNSVKYRIDISKANIRSNPDFNSQIISTLPKWTILDVLGIKGEWYHIEIGQVESPDKSESYGSSNISQKIQVKSFYEIAKKENKALFMAKDEFETKAEYGIRLEQQNKYIEYLNNEMLTELNAAREKKRKTIERKALEKKRMLQIKIQESLEQVVYSPSAISQYDPENSTFSLTVNYETHIVSIPRDDARTYKPVYKESKVEGFKQLRPDLKGYEYFNMVVVHPLTGKRFPYGPTKNIDSLKITFKKNIDEKYYGNEIEVTVVKKDGSTVNGVMLKKDTDYIWVQTQDQTPVKIIVDEIEFMSSSAQILNNNGKSTPPPLKAEEEAPAEEEARSSPPPSTPKVKFIPYDDPPRAIGGIRPVYPELAQEAGIEGVVVVQAFIDEKGRVKETIILKGISNTGLDEAAMEAIRKTRFKPAKQRERPVGVWISIPVNFMLK